MSYVCFLFGYPRHLNPFSGIEVVELRQFVQIFEDT